MLIPICIFFSSNDMHSLTEDLNKGNKRTYQLSQMDRLKFPINDPKSVHKKIRVCSTPKIETTCNGISKRRCDEQNEVHIIMILYDSNKILNDFNFNFNFTFLYREIIIYLI